jgi:hypothetical protein
MATNMDTFLELDIALGLFTLPLQIRDFPDSNLYINFIVKRHG